MKENGVRFVKKRSSGEMQPPPGAAVGTRRDPGDVGIFAGLFVASPRAVDEWPIETGVTPAQWPAVEFKRLETVKMGTLESILTGMPYDDIATEPTNLVRAGGAQGPWIIRARTPLVDALAILEDGRVETVAEAWADTDEFKVRPSDRPSRADVDSLSGALSAMRSLARVSKERGEPMFLMMAL